MNRLLIAALLLLMSGLFCFGEGLKTTEYWEDEPLFFRSCISTKPSVFVNGENLEIYFPGALDNVLIRVTNERSEVVFEECLSVQAMENYSINLSEKGGFQI